MKMHQHIQEGLGHVVLLSQTPHSWHYEPELPGKASQCP